MAPVELSGVNPDGSDPEVTLQWYGVLPPVALNVAL